MKKPFLILFFLTTLIYAETPDSTNNSWNPSLVAGANISQVAFSNWAKGGENAIAWTFLGDGRLMKEFDSLTFRSNLKIAYGRTKIGSADYRTTDNDLYWEKVLSLKVGWAVDPYVSNLIRTAVATGYDYKATPAQKIADFFDPGYVTQSIGFTYDKLSFFRTRLGVAFQETFTNKYRSYSDDPDTKDKQEAFKFETGLESITDGAINLDDNLIYKTKLRLFTRFEHPDTWDVLFDNVITAKVNSWLSVNFTYLVVYEKAQSPYTQIKQTLQMGIVYTIL
ncbi:hypothetical protein APF79_12170 [bacterium BRH_c32]|nr:MAG: hypothetical protein APF79_12170 [bacterium BRH_c32]